MPLPPRWKKSWMRSSATTVYRSPKKITFGVMASFNASCTAGRSDTQSRVQAASALHSGGSKKERTREDVAIVLRLMASMLRDLEAINAGADPAVLANPLLSGDLESIARAYSGDRARTAFGAVDRALTALERNAGIKVVTEWLAVQM